MKRSLALFILLTIALTGCVGRDPGATLTPTRAESGMTSMPGNASPGAMATTAPLSGPRATAAALAGQVTLNAPTRGPEADDYPDMVRHAWQLIYENYYSDEFNGVDWEAIRDEYVARAEQVDSQQEFWALMDEFVGQLDDDHSNFRTPDEVVAQFGSGEAVGRPFSGINMWPPPGRVPDFVQLWDVCQVGPAASAGLESGDLVLAVNGEEIHLTDETDVELLYREIMFGDGDSNSVTLTVQQGSDQDPRQVTLRLGGASGCGGWTVGIIVEEPRIGYIRVPDFGQGSDTVLLDHITSLEEAEPLDGLILDIRHNPGGNSDADIKLFTSGTFGTVGPLREGRTRTQFGIRGPVRWSETTPMAILTDQSSHSAADYFAVAMKLSGRATLVGMPTAGNTDGWTSWVLPDGSLVGIAVTILLLPDGTSIEGVGVQPDVRIPLEPWDLKQDPDPQLEAALNVMVDAASD